MTTPIDEDKRKLSVEERQFRTNDLMEHLERMLPHVESDTGTFRARHVPKGLLIDDEDPSDN